MSLLYRVPLFGGFCAPTQSPEDSCLRHFSNEYTVPGSPKFMDLSPCIEHSPCCIFCGSLGLGCADRRRKYVALFGAFLNFVALVLNIVAACGLSEDPGVLRSVHWVRGDVGRARRVVPADIYIGISMWADRVDCSESVEPKVCEEWTAWHGFSPRGDGEKLRSMRWHDAGACDRQEVGWGDGEEGAAMAALCEGCRSSLLPKTTLLAAVFAQVPAINADLQRSTRFGDVNCQATWGVVGNVLGFCLNFTALLAFRSACYRHLPSHAFGSSVVWSLGPGFVCIAAAISVKLVDATCHLIVPTPRERWTRPVKRLTLLEYLRLAPSARDLERGMAASGVLPEAPAKVAEEEEATREAAVGMAARAAAPPAWPLFPPPTPSPEALVAGPAVPAAPLPEPPGSQAPAAGPAVPAEPQPELSSLQALSVGPAVPAAVPPEPPGLQDTEPPLPARPAEQAPPEPPEPSEPSEPPEPPEPPDARTAPPAPHAPEAPKELHEPSGAVGAPERSRAPPAPAAPCAPEDLEVS